MKRILPAVAMCMVMLVPGVQRAYGDDTDAFLAHSAALSGRSLVMLVLDLHPRLAELRCSEVTDLDCRDKLGASVFAALDLLSAGSAGNWDPGADGLPDARQIPEEGARMNAWQLHDSQVTRLDELRAGLQVALAGPLFTSPHRRLGMMLNHASTCDRTASAIAEHLPQCSQGAYILKGFFQPVVEEGAPSGELQSLFDSLAAIPLPAVRSIGTGWAGHPFQLKDLYLEFYRYLVGGAVYNSPLNHDDFSTAVDNAGAVDSVSSPRLLPDRSIYEDSVAGSRYLSPLLPAADWACSDVAVVNLLLAEPDASTTVPDRFEANSALEQLLQAGDGTAVINILAGEDLAADGLGPVVEGRQSLTSHFIDLADAVDVAALADAGAGRGISVADRPQGLVAAMQALFTVAGPEGVSMAAASSALNVFDRSKMVDRLYLALFQPRTDTRWPGNIKKFRVDAPVRFTEGPRSPVSPGIVAANGQAALADDGGLAHGALSYWTDPDAVDVTPPNCRSGQPPLSAAEICGADGRSVTRGGAGQLLSGLNQAAELACAGADPGRVNDEACARQLYVESPAGQGAVIDFNRDESTAVVLSPYLFPEVPRGDPDTLEQTIEVIGWARGLYELSPSGDQMDTQRWLLGDVIHSRPLAVNYGDSDGAGGYSRSNPDIRLFFGSNDGWFRSLRDTESGGAQSGREVWGFLPLEFLPLQVKRAVNLPDREAEMHPYGVDGAPVAMVLDADLDGNVETEDGDRVYVFFGLRRGGRAYYALDVSDPDSPPRLLWKISDQSQGFEELALSFSRPVVARVNYDGNERAVLIFGGGYNGGWDAQGVSRVGKDVGRAGDPVGNAIFVVDAVSGELLWKAIRASITGGVSVTVFGHSRLQHSIASALSVVDVNRDGIDDRAYVGDTGGSVWRVNMPVWDGIEDARRHWSLTEIASLAGTGEEGDRRFFHAPDVVLAEDEINVAEESETPVFKTRRYAGVVIASGNRAAPADNRAVNFIYYLKDAIVTATAPASPLVHAEAGGDAPTLLDISLCAQGGEAACHLQSRAARAASLRYGWLLELSADGEKGLSSPITLDGTVFFASHVPAVSAASVTCTPAAAGSRFYAMDVSDGSVKTGLLATSDDQTSARRFIELDVSGIPDSLPFMLIGRGEASAGGEQSSGSVAGGHLLLPDGTFFSVGTGMRWKAYWREYDVDPQ